MQMKGAVVLAGVAVKFYRFFLSAFKPVKPLSGEVCLRNKYRYLIGGTYIFIYPSISGIAQAMLWIRITLMRTWIRLITLMRIRIRIQILAFTVDKGSNP